MEIRFNFYPALMALFFVSVLLMSCEESALQVQTTPSLQAPVPIEEKGVPLHPNTVVEEVSDSRSILTLPEGVYYVTSDETKAQPDLDGTLGVTCTCTEGSGCNPSKYKGKYSCTMTDGCSACTKETDAITHGGKSNGKTKIVTVHGLVDFNAGITWVTPAYSGTDQKDMFLSLEEESFGNAFPELFEVAKVKAGLKRFLNEFYDNEIPDFLLDNSQDVPEGYSYVLMNIYGNLGALPFPSHLLEGKRVGPGAYIGYDDKVTCECLSGSSGCTYDTAGMGQVKYCDAGDCTSCKLKD